MLDNRIAPLREAALVFVASAGGCMIAGRLIIPALIRAQRLAPLRYGDCPPLLAYQQTKPQVPTMGGLIVLGVAVAAALAAGAGGAWLVLVPTLGIGAIGLADDLLKFRGPNGRGLRSLPKLLLSGVVAIAVGVVTAAPTAGMMANALWILFVMLVIAGASHAVNLTDGMDGLAVGCLAMAFAAFGVLTLLPGSAHPALAVWCASFSGACVGFLWFNSFPASVFLGDVGAMGLGAALGTIGVVSGRPWWLAIVGGVFVAEAVSVMLQVGSYKWRNKKRVFRVAPLHHHVHLGGWPEPKVIARFWIAGLLLAALGLAQVAR
ncbi:MAG: phospho-N-acetylmuramoyl-pentapeptide-transferase [Candidatus Omnitrophica bacterium]|nr:phospho-N-acetylmuramoyl-pentapeptide-transferase [Candidatus Omnitrophota bacterium]